MTSFAFILGCVPLWFARGAGAASRQILGTVVVAGMLAATCLAVFLIPVLFVVVERFAGAERRLEAKLADRGNEPEAAKGRRIDEGESSEDRVFSKRVGSAGPLAPCSQTNGHAEQTRTGPGDLSPPRRSTAACALSA